MSRAWLPDDGGGSVCLYKASSCLHLGGSWEEAGKNHGFVQPEFGEGMRPACKT